MTYLALSDIQGVLSQLTHVNEESMVAFADHLDKYGIDDLASDMFQKLLKEEEEGRAREVEALGSMLADIDSEIAQIEPGAVREMQNNEKEMLEQYERVESECIGAYNALVHDVDTAVQSEQSSADAITIESIKKSLQV